MARTVSAFGPKLVEALRLAGTTGLTVRLPTQKAAIALRHRLYSLRKAMQAENHPIFDTAKNIILQVRPSDTDDTWLLQAATADITFDKELDEAGVTLTETPDLSDL